MSQLQLILADFNSTGTHTVILNASSVAAALKGPHPFIQSTSLLTDIFSLCVIEGVSLLRGCLIHKVLLVHHTLPVKVHMSAVEGVH